MSFLFGKKKEEKKIDINDTVRLLKDSISSLEKRRNFIDKNIDQERETARDWLKKGNKQKALNHMKKLKLYQKEADIIDGNIYNLETQRLTIESFVTTKNIIEVMKQSSQVLKQGPSQEQVSDLVDDINDSVQIQQEVSEELSRPIGPVFDEDELLGELEELEMNETLKKDVVLPIRSVSLPITEKDMPSVPISMVNKSIDSSEDELKELESLMS
jgi:DNA primase catalytic subunit